MTSPCKIRQRRKSKKTGANGHLQIIVVEARNRRSGTRDSCEAEIQKQMAWKCLPEPAENCVQMYLVKHIRHKRAMIHIFPTTDCVFVCMCDSRLCCRKQKKSPQRIRIFDADAGFLRSGLCFVVLYSFAFGERQKLESCDLVIVFRSSIFRGFSSSSPFS